MGLKTHIKRLIDTHPTQKFGNIAKLSIEYGCRIFADFEFGVKFGRIAVVVGLKKKNYNDKNNNRIFVKLGNFKNIP